MTEKLPNLKRVLVVDDQEIILHLWNRVLREKGFDVVTAKNGAQAVRWIDEGEFSIIFTDISMPEMGGVELLKYIKKKGCASCVNIITGLASVESAVECMHLGACDYIAKPCNINELIAMSFRCMRHYSHRLEVEKLKKTVANYEELDRMKTEFMSNVSHELRTPLFSMGGALDLMLQDMADKQGETSGKLGEVIRNNYGRLVLIVSNILNFFRMERGMFTPHFQRMDLPALIQKVLADLYPLFLQRGLHLESVAPGAFSPAHIEADPGQIEMILVNLIANAIKFTPAGGKVEIGLSDEGDNIRICVGDSGIGISPENHQKIFDRFYQVDASATRSAGGLGIGLSIVKALVEMHDGRISVESGKGKGSRFFIFLPKSQDYNRGGG